MFGVSQYVVYIKICACAWHLFHCETKLDVKLKLNDAALSNIKFETVLCS